MSLDIKLKRNFDFLAALIGLILLSPVMLLIALLVRIKLGTPVLFRQTRPGLHAKPFQMIKFRSMRDLIDNEGNTIPDEKRLTQFSKRLRSTSLDELPELWNVLKGDMSIVGPRPLLMEYLPLYNSEQNRRHEVCPGVTGWAQINGRNAITWEQKFKYDIWYVENHTLWLDIKIIFLTLVKVLKSEGVSPDDEVIMPKFTGNKD